MSQHAVPPEVDDGRRRIAALQVELEVLGRETTTGMEHQARQEEINLQLASEKRDLADLEKHWQEEKELVAKILDLRAKLLAGGAGQAKVAPKAAVASSLEPASVPSPSPAAAQDGNGSLTAEERAKVLAELKEVQAKLKQFQGESPLDFSQRGCQCHRQCRG